MRSLRFASFGDPLEVLQVEDLASPEPEPGEVRVRVAVRPINPSDLLTVRGLYGRKPALPATPGYEGVGRIEAIGPGVTRWSVGQRVIPMGPAGTWQEQIVHPAAQLISVPDEVPDPIAAQFVVNPLTAWLLLQEVPLPPGGWILQTAAGSTLGRILVQMARLRGLRTINVVRRAEHVAELYQLGADEVVDLGHEDLKARVEAATGGAGVAVALDAVAGGLAEEVLRTLSPGGTLVVYGTLSMQHVPLDGSLLIFRGVAVRGFWLSSWFQTSTAQARTQVFGEVMSMLARGMVKPPVDSEFDLADHRAAIVRAQTPGRHGKVLLVG
jgi:NADPH:quinone reductase-like Zn-dependent oxidoreductase